MHLHELIGTTETLLRVFEASSIVFITFCFFWIIRTRKDYRWYNIAFGGLMSFYVVFHFTIHLLGLTSGTHQLADNPFDFAHFMLDDIIIILSSILNAAHKRVR